MRYISTLRDFLASVIGSYTPIIDASGNVPAGCAGVDWTFVLSGLLFVAVVFCVLKCIGGLICKIF